jgi:hypothetical protein
MTHTNETPKPSMPGHEKRKVTIDLLKHVGTVSIALIVYMHYANDKSPVSLTPGVVSSFMTLISSTISAFIVLMNIDDFDSFLRTKTHYLLRFLFLINFLTFLFSVSFLVYVTVV